MWKFHTSCAPHTPASFEDGTVYKAGGVTLLAILSGVNGCYVVAGKDKCDKCRAPFKGHKRAVIVRFLSDALRKGYVS